MLLDEIVQLDQWLTDKESNYGAIQKLGELHAVLTANVQAITSRSQQPIQPFSEQKKLAEAESRTTDLYVKFLNQNSIYWRVTK